MINMLIKAGNFKCWGKSALMCGLIFLSSTVAGSVLDQQRKDFVQAEKLLEQGNEAAFLELSRTLTNYPLYPFLQYQWLKNNLGQTDKIKLFLRQYQESRFARLLRGKWLAYLADHEHWQEFIQYYQADDDAALACQFYWGLYNTGDKQQALLEAKRLWGAGDVQSKACDPLLQIFTLSQGFTRELNWQRFEQALKKDNTALAEYVRRLFNKSDQINADRWLQVHKKPLLIQESSFWLDNNAQTVRIFAHAIKRMAKSDLDLAIQIWDSRKTDLAIDQSIGQDVEHMLALALAYKQDSRAYDRLSQLALVDDSVREWKVRAALLEQNWQHVADALASLSGTQRQEPGWRYWLARSLEAAGDGEGAQMIYLRLAEERSFYGFLAADRVDKPYNLADKPVSLAVNQLDALAEQLDFKVVREFSVLNRELEARRQWWYAISKLSTEQLKVAAKLAQQWQWDQIAIITLVKADYCDDISLRFPVRYLAEVRDNAFRHDLDPAIIYGVMRQESMLDKYALSPVGARGLMQVMPATSRQIATELHEAQPANASLFNPGINIRHGSYYLKKLLKQFGDHFALAIAAYNAGPYRVLKWLPSGSAIPADIWIETIPFKETRKYLESVLSYAIIYQHYLPSNKLKIKKLLPDVPPH